MIAIPNMEKPKDCRTCNFKSNKEGECWFVHDENDCPLIEIVTCGECKWWKNGTCEQWSDPHEFDIIETEPDDFCSYGERRSE